MKMTLASLAAVGILGSAHTLAADIDVTINNATKNIYFTPLLVTAHSESVSLFQAGEAASPEIEAMAEGGDISGLSSLATNAGAVVARILQEEF